MGRLRLVLFGGFQLRLDSSAPVVLPSKKAQALLAYLAVRPGELHSRDKLSTLLWGDRGDEQARHSLRQTLFELRRLLPPSAGLLLVAEGEGLAVNGGLDADVTAFERLVKAAEPAPLQRAVDLYRGDFLEGLHLAEPAFEEWVRVERQRLRELARAALTKLLRHRCRAGDTPLAMDTAVKLLALDPLQESVHRTLIRLHLDEGRRAEALRQYETCAALLDRELGVEPEAETKALYREIVPAGDTAARRGSGGRPRTAPSRSADASMRSSAAMPLIGRDREVSELRRRLDETWRGQGSVVAIRGDAGIGKSRLVDALRADATKRGGRVLWGNAYELERILAFRPWVDAFRSNSLLTDPRRLTGLGAAWRVSLARLLPELEEPAVMPRDDFEDPLRLFEATAQLLEHLATREPIVLVLEDFHHADEMSVRLLSFLARRQRLPVLVVVTVREDDVRDAPLLAQLLDELAAEGRLLDVRLSPLSTSETAALTVALAPAPADEPGRVRLREQVWTISAGNPFMVVETMRAIQEGSIATTAPILPLPERVRALIGGRLKRLSDHARQLASAAAVVGRPCEDRLLHRVTGLAEDEASAALEELLGRRIMHRLGEGLDFSHDRIREVVYDHLNAARRKAMHGLVVRAIEACHADDLAPLFATLAAHAREAEDWVTAHVYFKRAAERAYLRVDLHEAAAALDQALIALERLPRTPETLREAVDLRLAYRFVLITFGDAERIRRILDEAEPFCRTLGDRVRQGWIDVFRCSCLRLLGRYADAIAAGERACAVASELGDGALEIMAQYQLGQACYLSVGDFRRGRDLLSRAVARLDDFSAAEPSDAGLLPFLRSPYRPWRGLHVVISGELIACHAELGELREGLTRATTAVRLADSLEAPYVRALAYYAAGRIHLARRDVSSATGFLEEAVNLCGTHDFRWFWVPTTAVLASAYSLCGRVPEAIRLLEQALERASAMKAPIGFILMLLSQAHLHAGRLDDAEDLAVRTLALARQRGERGIRARTLRILTEIIARREPPDVPRAAACFDDAVKLAEELGMQPLVAACHFVIGRLYRDVGQCADAEKHLATATRMFREMDAQPWLDYIEAQLAHRPAVIGTGG